MRLIDAYSLTEKLKKEIKSDKINRNSGAYCTASFPWWHDWLKSIVEKQPTVDAVEVVRCKNCRFYISATQQCDHEFWMDVEGWPANAEQDGFCHKGEMIIPTIIHSHEDHKK